MSGLKSAIQPTIFLIDVQGGSKIPHHFFVIHNPTVHPHLSYILIRSSSFQGRLIVQRSSHHFGDLIALDGLSHPEISKRIDSRANAAESIIIC